MDEECTYVHTVKFLKISNEEYLEEIYESNKIIMKILRILITLVVNFMLNEHLG